MASRSRRFTPRLPSIKRTPAMAAGIEGRIWSVTDIAALLD
jgi:hypothetical protein